ncbi:hypothetical protein Hanom_Chr12g01141411 [Helianthus anomalus]
MEPRLPELHCRNRSHGRTVVRRYHSRGRLFQLRLGARMKKEIRGSCGCRWGGAVV